jgi:hypothetical protein
MRKNNKHPSETQTDDCSAISENISENEKYIKKLALQRSVLNKLVDTGKVTPSPVKNPLSPNPELNQSQTNK